MNLTSKSRYALKIMMDLTHNRHLHHVKRGDVCKRQGIPADYLDQIMIRLRSGKLVESIRGRGGGYKLAKPPENITLWDLFSVVEDTIYPVECAGIGDSCDFEKSCIAHSAWGKIITSIREPLIKMNLLDLATEWHSVSNDDVMMKVQECKAGRSRLVHTPNLMEVTP